MRTGIILCMFFCTIAFGVVIPSITIDTRVEYTVTQSTYSFVFDSQRTYSSTGDYAFGDVAFRGGLLANQSADANKTTTLRLGITPPVGGTLQLASGVNNTTYKILSDLTLGEITFSGLNSLNKFFFNIAGPYTIFMDSDVTLGSNQFSLVSTAGGVLDGHTNILRLATDSLFQIISSGTGATVKNLFIQGATSTNFDVSSATNLTFENVEIIAIPGQTAVLTNPHITFSGQFGVFGYGGTISIQTPSASTINFATQTQLYVFPQTTLSLDASHLTVNFTDFSSILFLDNCNINVTNGKAIFKGGTVIVNGAVTLQAGALQLGDGTAVHNCDLQILPGSKFIVADGATLINNNV